MNHLLPLLKKHSDWSAVELIYHTLTANGYKAFLAGGCVRDALLGKLAHDLDIATDASPEKIENLFEKTVSVGKVFGVMRVIMGDSDIEVATFRTDGLYVDGRRPEHVTYSTPSEDAKRRDFTINALFFDLQTNQVLDFIGGERDLRARLLRTVGDAELRFEEDHLRLLRAVRFVSQLGFELDEKTFVALKKMAPKVKSVSGERIRDEFAKLLKGPNVNEAMQLLEVSGLLAELFPFRLKNNLWYGNYGANEDWQNFALFFREASSQELTEGLNLLRLSARDRRAIEKTWTVWNEGAQFFENRDGAVIRSFVQEGVVFALHVLSAEGSSWTAKIKNLFLLWESMGQHLPKAFLSGDDVKSKLTGKDIGRCLDLAMELQIEKALESRDAALEWFQKYIEKAN